MLHAIVRLVDFGDIVDRYGPVPITVPAMAAVSDAPVHVAGVVNGVAYAGGLPDHNPLAVDGEHDKTDEHPARITAPGMPERLGVTGEAAVSAAEENATPADVLEKLDPPLPPKGR